MLLFLNIDLKFSHPALVIQSLHHSIFKEPFRLEAHICIYRIMLHHTESFSTTKTLTFTIKGILWLLIKLKYVHLFPHCLAFVSSNYYLVPETKFYGFSIDVIIVFLLGFVWVIRHAFNNEVGMKTWTKGRRGRPSVTFKTTWDVTFSHTPIWNPVHFPTDTISWSVANKFLGDNCVNKLCAFVGWSFRN